jgi:hypothetical protein
VLPARELRKTRYSLEDAGCTYGVDVFDGQLTGLILAEVGFETSDQMNEQWHLPPCAHILWTSLTASLIRRQISSRVRLGRAIP